LDDASDDIRFVVRRTVAALHNFARTDIIDESVGRQFQFQQPVRAASTLRVLSRSPARTAITLEQPCSINFTNSSGHF
jgi:hypothetical protein